MKHFYLLFIAVIYLVMFTTCKGDEKLIDDDDDGDDSPHIEVPVDDDFETNPGIVNIEDAVVIAYDKQTATITNPYEGKGITITCQDANVVIHSTITDTAYFVITGLTSAGSLKIYSESHFELIMNGVSIINENDPALNIQSHKKVKVRLVDGTSNRLVGGKQFASEGGVEDVKAAFFSEGQLIFSGEGSLLVISRYRHGICSDDYVRINSGAITVQVAASNGIRGKDAVEINGGKVDIHSMSDGIKSNGNVLITGGSIQIATTEDKAHGIKSVTETTIQTTGQIEINVQGDAAKAFKCDGNMLISSGIIRIITSGDALFDAAEPGLSSAAGIKCDGNLLINGGQIDIISTGSGGKGVNVNGTFTMSNGELSAITTGNEYKYRNDNTKAKAVSIDKSLTINGGTIYASCKTDHAIATNSPLSVSGGTVIAFALDASKKSFNFSNSFKVTGGVLLGISGASSLPTSSVSTQYAVNYSGSITQGAFLHVASTAGKNILTCQLPCSLSKAFVLFSNPDLQNNMNCTISSGGTVSGGTSFHGLYNGATYTGGSTLSNFTVTSMVTNVN